MQNQPANLPHIHAVIIRNHDIFVLSASIDKGNKYVTIKRP